MKKIILTGILLVTLMSCKKEKTNEEVTEKIEIAPVKPALAENAVVYEANIRQYSPEGNFDKFTNDIPKIKKMGVKILWIMPIYEVGIKNRKAYGKKSIEQITDTVERKKYLGSNYSIKNYTSIDTHYGNKEDFQKLVDEAHKNGIYVILDWVANHTSWDHDWVTKHSDYYTHDKAGKMKSPFDWSDVVELDYNNPALRKAMIAEMKYWLTNFNIDGFRCDVAGEVPTDFWGQATAALKKVKPIFMLAEAEKPELQVNAFDMGYGWEAHHIFNQIAQGKKTVKDWDAYMTKKTVKNDDITMYFTSNHDENSWNGSEYERMGDAVEVFAAMTFVIPGTPLIYNGQEYDLKKRLKFFEKDTIPHVAGKMGAIYQKLGKLKVENEALNGGKNPASYKRITTSDDACILAFEREKNGKKVIFIANLSKISKQFTVNTDGNFTDGMSSKKITLTKNQKQDFKPWQYYILIP